MMSRAQEMFSLIADFESSPLNGQDFCKSKNLARSIFYYWKKKKAQQSANTGFVEVRPSPSSNKDLELIYPNGIRIKLEASDMALISKLIRLF
jgi:hypothetical protein